MHTDRALAESIKREVLSEIERDRKMVDSIKEEILADLQIQRGATNASAVAAGQARASHGSSSEDVWDTTAERIRDEVMAAVRSELDHYTHRPSLDAGAWHNYAGRTDSYDRGMLQKVRNDLKRELQAIRDIEMRISSISDPYIRDLAHAIVTEARDEGVSLDEVIRRMDASGVSMQNGWTQMATGWFSKGQNRGFMWGVGATALAVLLLPTLKQWLRAAGDKSTEAVMGMTGMDEPNTGISYQPNLYDDDSDSPKSRIHEADDAGDDPNSPHLSH